MIQPLIYFGLSAGCLSTLIYFILKTAVAKSFDFAIEKYKSEIGKELESHKQKLQLEIERFKSDLNIISIEHNISFGKLQKERAKVIKNTYNKLVELSKQLQILTSMFQGPKWHVDRERDKAAEIAFNDLRDYLVINRIYLPKDVCEKNFRILEESWSIMVDMSITKDYADEDEINGKTPLEKWRDLNNKVTKEIALAMTELEDNFRRLLGDK